MTNRLITLDVLDIRFPTSRSLDGSDAMNPDPDYSATYVVIKTDRIGGPEGHGLTFTIGRGNDICCAAVNVLRDYVIGRTLEEIAADMGAFSRSLTGDSQLRWLGPEKGVIHLATSAVLNAVWDLWAKTEGKPLWKLLVDLSPAELVRCVDFRYLSHALTNEQAIELLTRGQLGRAERETRVRQLGFPAYTTAAGWLGYDDDKLRRLARRGIEQGFTHFKMKVGRDLADDQRRLGVVRETIGPDRTLMVDANQVWEVGQAIEWMKQLAEFKPMWIEEPTSPDDVLGHQAIAKALNPLGIGVATGEHCQNRILFKQFMAAGAMQYVQADAGRLGGVNECLAVFLLAKRFDLPVCPHAGGVGLCEMVQHLSIWDYVACGGTEQGRVVEYVDHLHEHFLDPARIVNGRYACPSLPGYSTEMKPVSIAAHMFPVGAVWEARTIGNTCPDILTREGKGVFQLEVTSDDSVRTSASNHSMLCVSDDFAALTSAACRNCFRAVAVSSTTTGTLNTEETIAAIPQTCQSAACLMGRPKLMVTCSVPKSAEYAIKDPHSINPKIPTHSTHFRAIALRSLIAEAAQR